MRVRYILGRAGTGKTSLVFKEIKHRLEENTNEKLYLLVPEQFTLQTEFDLINKNNLEGIMKVEVLSFELLAQKVFDEMGGLNRIDINELGKIMVLRRLFDEYEGELEIYQKSAQQEGFLSNLCSLISEFKKNDISPDLLKESISSFEEENILKRKLHDISLIYEKFSQYMDGRYTDEEDKLNMLINKIEESSFLNESEVWIDSFSGFTLQEYRILEKILLKAKKVNMTFTLDPKALKEMTRDRELFSPTKETFNKIREIVHRHGIKETKTILDYDIKKPEGLKHIEKEIYSYPYNKYRDNPIGIEIFSGTNQYTEIENVASKIISLVRDKKYRWKDIALVNGAMDIYGPTIKRVFNEYNIPFFLDEKRSIMNNPIIKLIISALDIVYRNFKYEDVFRFIKTGFSPLTKEEYERLENYVLRFGIKGSRWIEDFTYEIEDLNEINEIRNRFIAPFINMKEKIKSKNHISQLSTIIFQFLEEIKAQEKLDKWIEKLREEGRIEYVNENTQIWNIVMEVFDQLVEILGDINVSLKEYRKILETGFSQYEVGIIPPTIDQVLIGNLERSRSHDIKALFIVGVNDGILPSGFNDEGLLLDDEKAVIKDIGIPISSDSQTKIEEEQFSIYATLSKPSEYLWISYGLSDNEGKALRPSILIERLKKLYPTIVINSDIFKGNDEESRKKQSDLISTPISTLKYLIENMRLKIDGNPVDSMWDEVYYWYYSNRDWKERINTMIEGLFYDNQVSYIGKKRAKTLYNAPLKSSISRLEKFVNCPFAHFIDYGLNPQERKEYKIKTPDIGRLFHDSMEKFAKAISLENLDWKELGREKCDDIVEKVIDEIAPEFDNNILLSSHRYKYLVNKLKRVSKRAAWTVTEHIKKGDFTPALYELGFGEGRTYDVPPIIIELPHGDQIKLEGRIDRVDILEGDNESYVRIVDYKSGNKKFSLSEVYYGLQIQLVVYLDAVIENSHRIVINEAHPGGVFYFKLDDPIIETNINDKEAIEKEIMKKLKMDGIIAKDIRIAKAMDNEIEQERNSNVVPVALKKDGDFAKYSSVLEEENINYLINHVRNLIVEIAGEILKGNIKIEPCKIDNRVPCSYCKYSGVCQFDKNFENNRYRVINKLKDEEVIEKIKSESRSDMDAKMD